MKKGKRRRKKRRLVGCVKASELLFYTDGTRHYGKPKMKRGYWCQTHQDTHEEEEWEAFEERS